MRTSLRIMEHVTGRIALLLALAFCLSLAPCAAQAGDDVCAANYQQRVKIATRLARIRRIMDAVWPSGTPCNAACQRLQTEASALLDEQLRLEVIGDALGCPMHPEDE